MLNLALIPSWTRNRRDPWVVSTTHCRENISVSLQQRLKNAIPWRTPLDYKGREDGRTSLRESEREGERERERSTLLSAAALLGEKQLWGFGMRVVAVFTLDLNQIYVAPGAPEHPEGVRAHSNPGWDTSIFLSFSFLYDRAFDRMHRM